MIISPIIWNIERFPFTIESLLPIVISTKSSLSLSLLTTHVLCLLKLVSNIKITGNTCNSIKHGLDL